MDLVEQDLKVRYKRRDMGEWCDFCDKHTVNCFGFWTLGDGKYIQVCLSCMKELGAFAEKQEVLDEPPEPPSQVFMPVSGERGC